jgi:hypothetical protein
MVFVIDHDIAAFKNLIHVAVRVYLACNEVALVVAANLAGRVPILLGVNEKRAIFCIMKIYSVVFL